MKKIVSIMIVILIATSAFVSFAGEQQTKRVKTIMVEDHAIQLDVDAQIINGKMMIPLAQTLEPLGYEVQWNTDKRSVEILKGAQWTKVFIDENSYFKNKMAPHPLSHAPVIIEGRTLVPIEFFSVILDLGIAIDDGQLAINDNQMDLHSGYIQQISAVQDNNFQLVLSPQDELERIEDLLIINVSQVHTYVNTNLEEGKFIHVISKPMMTMSIPGQTPGDIIY